MTISEASKLIGGYVDVTHASCSFEAKVADLKMSYGSWRVLLKPVSGVGETWVNLDGLTVYSVSRASDPRAIRGTIWPVVRSSEELDTLVFSSDTNS